MNQVTADDPGASVWVDVEQDGIGSDDWTGAVTRTVIRKAEICSVTRSEGHMTADAGGSIDFSGPKVSVSIWGQTSATVH
jgi:hypothetical protein